MNRRVFWPLTSYLLLVLFVFTVLAQPSRESFLIDSFSKETEEDGIPKGWKALTFNKIPNRTRYSIIQDGKNYVVKAISQNSASGILKEIGINPNDFPILTWRWKVGNMLKNSDATKKSGDDFSARIYVAFEYDPEKASFWEKAKYGAVKLAYGKYPPKGVLNYVWDSKLSTGTSWDNPYTDKAKMIVVESGIQEVGQWVSEERDILKDYRDLFHADPPKVSFIAIMTDTDNTGGAALAYYDDLILKKRLAAGDK